MARIFSYVVRYDSGFAPNPFYGYCTLATCKPKIRQHANIGDWIVGCASNARPIRRGGHLVYAMRITEAMSWDDYSRDDRFQSKKPFRKGSRKQSCGDNIYFHATPKSKWSQRDSFHSLANGQPHSGHVSRDTSINRVLISNDFLYFGGEGPVFPTDLVDEKGRTLCKRGRGESCFIEQRLLVALEGWIRSFNLTGFQGPPQEWVSLREKNHER